MGSCAFLKWTTIIAINKQQQKKIIHYLSRFFFSVQYSYTRRINKAAAAAAAKMDRAVIASQQSYSLSSTPRIIPQHRCYVIPSALFPSNLNPISSGFLKLPRVNLRCKSTGDSGENESRTVLDAFFLGKALGEVLNERIESTMGEFLSIIGRLQAEQQKQVLEFQEEVLVKARQGKEKASREAVEAQGPVSSSSLSKPTNEDPFFQAIK